MPFVLDVSMVRNGILAICPRNPGVALAVPSRSEGHPRGDAKLATPRYTDERPLVRSFGRGDPRLLDVAIRNLPDGTLRATAKRLLRI
jgi:hypothetical protein